MAKEESSEELQNEKAIREESETLLVGNTGENIRKDFRIGKRILIAAGILIASFVLCLCVMAVIKVCNKSRSRDRIYVQQDALEYLEKRYGEEFIVIYNRGMGYAYNYVQLYAYPKGYSDEKHKFEIQGYYNKWGKLDYYDSYVMVKLTDDYEAYLDPIIGKYFDEYKFYLKFNSEWLTSNLLPDTKLEDLWKLKANEDYSLPRVFLYLNWSEEKNYNDTVIQALSEELQAKNFRGVISILIYYNQDLFEKRNRENIYEPLAKSSGDVEGNNIFIYDQQIEY